MVKKSTQIVSEVLNVLKAYTDKLTLRQIYYRLVAKLLIGNNTSEYKYLSKILVDARKDGRIGWDVMEDRTRSVENHMGHYTSEVEFFERRINNVYTAHDDFFLYNDLYQPDLTVILLEKQALESIFDKVCRQYNAILVVCRGYNSLTQLRELYDILEKVKIPIHVRFFSDFDPTGLDIQRNFFDQGNELGMKFASFKRVALTEELITKYGLPPAPAKTTDSRAKNWGGKGVVELDALDPAVLRQLIEAAIREHFDMGIYNEVKRLEKVLKRRIERKVDVVKDSLGYVEPDADGSSGNDATEPGIDGSSGSTGATETGTDDDRTADEEGGSDTEHTLHIQYKCSKCGKFYKETEPAAGQLVPEAPDGAEWDAEKKEYIMQDGQRIPGYLEGVCDTCKGKGSEPEPFFDDGHGNDDEDDNPFGVSDDGE
jgi:hypothetical protein